MKMTAPPREAPEVGLPVASGKPADIEKRKPKTVGLAAFVERARRSLGGLSDSRRAEAEVAAARSYRLLARQLLADFGDRSRGVRVAVCSVGRRRLSTEALLMLSYYLHDEDGGKVLLVDDTALIDTVGASLQVNGGPGLLDVFDGAQSSMMDLIQSTAQTGVYVLPMGQTPIQWLSPSQLRELPGLMDELANDYAYVLVQQSSILDDSSHRFFTKGADLALVLIEDGVGSVEEGMQYHQSMVDAEAKAVRVVLCCSA